MGVILVTMGVKLVTKGDSHCWLLWESHSWLPWELCWLPRGTVIAGYHGRHSQLATKGDSHGWLPWTHAIAVTMDTVIDGESHSYQQSSPAVVLAEAHRDVGEHDHVAYEDGHHIGA